VFFSISDLIGVGNTNFVPAGTQQFTATVIGLPSNLGSHTYTVTYPASFDVNHDDDVTLVLSTATSQSPTIACPAPIVTNLAPCQAGVSVAFSTSVTGVPYPVVTCLLGTNIITSPFVFPPGTNTVSCTASNASGTDSCSFTVTVLPAPAPVPAATVQLGTPQNTSASFPAAKLAAKGKSPSGNPLNVSAVSATSTNNGTIILVGGVITYTPPAGFVGQDAFSYTLSDGCESAQGTVTVTITPNNTAAHNSISITISGSTRALVFAGIPGQNYVVQWASSPTGPWSDLTAPITAGASGLILYNDTTAPMPPQRYYRTRVSSP
jgi:hypothetical protein